jgi:hypothetical protein
MLRQPCEASGCHTGPGRFFFFFFLTNPPLLFELTSCASSFAHSALAVMASCSFIMADIHISKPLHLFSACKAVPPDSCMLCPSSSVDLCSNVTLQLLSLFSLFTVSTSCLLSLSLTFSSCLLKEKTTMGRSDLI